MYKPLYLILLLISLAGSAQIPEGFPVPGKSDLPEAKFNAPRYFTAESLFGYMNGGAELYREYGITDAVITEFDIDERYYKCEVFRMKGNEEAFGIYSVSKYKCLSSPGFSQYTCLNRYQIQVCKGPYYISIINRSGTSADSLAMLKVAELLADKTSEPSADLKTFIPDLDPETIKGDAVLVKGKLGLANGATEWEDFFKDQNGYYALISESPEKTTISVRFANEEDFRLFITFRGWGLCELSISDVTIDSGETLRLLGNNHILIRVPATAK
ncbi:MAG: DUF6599 family protein [Bacteroidota bacterium]